MRGYAGKFAEVDLSAEKTVDTQFEEEILREYIGGRGLATKILWDRLGSRWEIVDPLGSENVLLVLAGPLTGFFPGSRVCVSGKSPQSNGVIGSTVAGEFPVEMKCAGYDGLVITGEASRPSYLFVTDSGVEIRDARQFWGKNGKQTMRLLTKEGRSVLKERNSRLGVWKEPAMVYIGSAGENIVRTAAVMSKWAHAAGYGGYGAVMGSKNLKAILAKGTGPLPEVEDLEKVKMLMDQVCRNAYESELFRWWGTAAMGYVVGFKTSSEPVRNWQEEWHNEKGFGVDQFERVWIKRYWGDFGCPTTCLKIAMTKTGRFKGAIGDNPDYELQAYLGTNLGIFSPEENVYLSSLIDDLGLCGIQTGNLLGFACELYEKGILTKEDLDGLDLNWGDAEAFATLARKIAARKGCGNLFADGVYRAALRIQEMKKKDVLQYAVQEKGVGIGAHGIRSEEDYPMNISYACSVQAGDHTSVAYLPITHSISELTRILADSGVYCFFNTFGLSKKVQWEFLEAVTGWNVAPREWYDVIARRILHLQRALLLIGGPDLRWSSKVDDENPPRFYEPLLSGPYAGKTVNRVEFRESRSRYYRAVGWDETGIPTPEELTRLRLGKVDKKLAEKVRDRKSSNSPS
jgi:aldehyde:ferredoxin oxidoreductase